jgi:hypothetical protein
MSTNAATGISKSILAAIAAVCFGTAIPAVAITMASNSTASASAVVSTATPLCASACDENLS